MERPPRISLHSIRAPTALRSGPYIQHVAALRAEVLDPARAGGIIAIRVFRTFSLDSTLRFTILERPAVGSVRVFSGANADAELVHLAPHRAAAEQWLSEHGYPHAVLQEVSADEAAADAVEGRVAA